MEEREYRRLKIYVASSWRNPRQPSVVAALRGAGHDVYDFRHPDGVTPGFAWSHVDPQWRSWTPGEFREGLQAPAAARGFDLDMHALRSADVTVVVLPCGRSAHLELGFAAGVGQRTFVLCDSVLDEPELMYLMCSRICLDVPELISAIGEGEPRVLPKTGT